MIRKGRAMKKTILCLLCLALLTLSAFPARAAEEIPAAPISLWSGNEDTSWFSEDFAGYDAATKTYTLTTADQFAGLGAVANAQNDYLKGCTVRLGSNLVFNEGDASAWGLFNQPENIWAPIPNFKGTLDGAGYAISGIFASGANKVALFASVDGATIRNLAIVNSYFLATDAPVAAFAGEVNDHPAVFEALYTDAFVNGAYNGGGIVGRFMENCAVMKAEATVFDSCVFAGKIDVTHWPAGGMLGNSNLSRATVKNCINAGTVKAGEQYAGGLIGLAKKNVYVFEHCLSLGTVVKCPASGAFLGEADQTEVTMTGCYYRKAPHRTATTRSVSRSMPLSTARSGPQRTAPALHRSWRRWGTT